MDFVGHSPSLPSADSGDDIDTLSTEGSVDDTSALAPEAGVDQLSSDASPDEFLADEDDLEEGEIQEPASALATRAYQREMLDLSLKKNVIVAMDTGSGKTQVAVLRIQAELEKESSRDKIIWFLAPTVALCLQQHDVLERQIPSVKMRRVTGNDKVESWAVETWNIILDGIRVIVSTIQILEDALTHGFVKLGNISLLVFDEAHNCVGKSPGSMVMNLFYHPQKCRGQPVPAILGLTASPIMKSKVKSIASLENLLDAVCVSPTIHREELLKHVNKPRLTHLHYEPGLPSWTSTMRSLQKAHMEMDITRDPYILRLAHEGTEKSYWELATAIKKRDTFAQTQMDALSRRSREIQAELGSWAADHYIRRVVNRFLEQPSWNSSSQWRDEENRYMAETLRKIDISPPELSPGASDMSSKVKLLISVLLSFQGNAAGIVFVKERATTTILLELLSSFPAITGRYRMGKMVGFSSFEKRKNMYGFIDQPDGATLKNFRTGKVNLLIATSVLEEGIDVPACNLIVCFDTPPNLKSFIQRRGRARMRESSLVILGDSHCHPDWETLEQDMKKQYDDDERELNELRLLETSEDTGSLTFTVEATGATLSAVAAVKHLCHFCQVLSGGRDFLDSRPDYIIHHEPHGGNGSYSVRATVLLPSFLPADLRRADSAFAWQAEANAVRDAAFQAYVMLYKAGLINDHLLPLRPVDVPGVGKCIDENRPQLVQSYVPWRWIAEAWREPTDRWLYPVFVKEKDGIRTRSTYNILLPVYLPTAEYRKVPIYPDHDREWAIQFGQGKKVPHDFSFDDQVSILLNAHFGHRRKVEDRDQVIKVTTSDGEVLSRDQISAMPFDPKGPWGLDQKHLVRDMFGNPCLCADILPSKPPIEKVRRPFHGYADAPKDVPYIALKRWPRRTYFLYPPMGHRSKVTEQYLRVCPLSLARVDTMDLGHVEFGMLLPSIIHELGIQLTARRLNSTIIESLGIEDYLVQEAITSKCAQEHIDYERLEFLGDSILKYCAVVQITADYPYWPEGYLSFHKDKIVSNNRLRHAAITHGLAKFIVWDLAGRKTWRPLYIDDFLGEGALPDTKPKVLPSKTIADVVESLIGASYVSGRIPKALKCISIFLNDVKWRDEGVCRQALHDRYPVDKNLPPFLEPLEELIGYSFQKKAVLIEAMTHASHLAESGLQSFERLEFLGDAILDYIIVTKVFERPAVPLSHMQMHLLKTVMTNADFLAFIVMAHSVPRRDVVLDDGEIRETQTRMPLWKFMRHSAPYMIIEQEISQKRFEALQEEILHELNFGTEYPWELLARLDANKYYSDLFEALLGAVWVDSGSPEVCEQIMERFGILHLLDRMMMGDETQLLHPKERLGILSGQSKVIYADEVVTTVEGEQEHGCRVFVGERLMAEVRGRVNKEAAQSEAARVAVRILTEERMELDGDGDGDGK